LPSQIEVKWQREHFSHQTGRERTSTGSAKEWHLRMAGKYWPQEEPKAERNWLFLMNPWIRN